MSSGEIEYGLGLLPSSEQDWQNVKCSVFADSGLMMTGDQLRKALVERPIVSGRDRFDDSWIGNQQHLGACCGFAAAFALARARVRRGLSRVMLSGFALYSAINGGVDGGAPLARAFEWLQTKGVPPQIAGEKPHYLWRQVNPQAKAQAEKYKGFELYQVTSELELAVGLYCGFDAVVAGQARGSGWNVNGDGLVQVLRGGGNHAWLLDGIKLHQSGQFWFDMANSWSLQWGVRGRAWNTWDHFRGTIQNHKFFLIRSTSDGDQQFPVPMEG